MKTRNNSFSKVLLVGLCFFIGASLSLSAKLKHRQIDGREYVSLASVARHLKMDKDRQGTVMTLSSKWNKLRFRETSREYLLNGLRMHLGFPVIRDRFKLYLSRIDYDKHVAALLRPAKASGRSVVKRIVIDSGHGGHDSGGRNKKLELQEKTMALDLAHRLKAKLEDAGFEVILTRKDDRFIELKDRPLIANRAQADLFLSLHFNALDRDTVQGVETFALTPSGMPSTSSSKLSKGDGVVFRGNAYDNRNALLSYCVQSRMVKELGAVDRGMKRARFAVLKHVECPGVLIEGGFLTHPKEGAAIHTDEYRERLAKSIANGVFMYHKMIINLLRKGS